MQDLWSLLGRREIVNEERKSIRDRIRVTKARIRIKEAQKYSGKMYDLYYLEHALESEEKCLITFAHRLGEIDRRIAEITADMEQSANRQEGADNED